MLTNVEQPCDVRSSLCVCNRCVFAATWLLCPSRADPKIVPVLTGAIVASQEPVLEIKSYADVYVTLAQPQPESQWRDAINRIRGLVENFHHPGSYGPGSGYKLLLLNHLDILTNRFERTNPRTRQKRGLFNFVGDIASGLFGIPSASDIEGLKKANRVLAETVDGIVRTQRRTIARVNQIGRKQKEMAIEMNKIIRECQYQRRVLTGLARQERDRTWATRIMLLLDILEARLLNYEETMGQAQAVRVACEARLVTEQVLPMRIAKQIVEHQPQVDLVSYYAYIQVTKIMETDMGVYCVLRAPEFSVETSTLYNIQTFPICEQPNRCLEIKRPDPFVLKASNEDLYFPVDCIGPKPRACRPGIVYDKTQQLCLHGLITHDPRQMQTCPITIHASEPQENVQSYELNKYFVTTEATDYHYRCPTVTPRRHQLTKGHYLITVEPECVMDTPIWTARGIPVKEVNVTLEFEQPQSIPTEWLVLPNDTQVTLKLPPAGLNKITVPTYQDIFIPHPPDVIQQIDQINSKIGVKGTPWWIWLIVAIVIAIALVIGLCYCHQQCKCVSPVMTKTRPSVKYDADRQHCTIDMPSHLQSEDPNVQDVGTQLPDSATREMDEE